MMTTSFFALWACLWPFSLGSKPAVIDFTLVEGQTWRPLNDNVMGGRSSGAITWSDAGMSWSGATRLENNGGFSSVRSPWGSSDFSDLKSITITCRGTGGPFKLTLETSRTWYLPYAFAAFEPESEWSEITLPLEDFRWSQAFIGDTGFTPSLSNVLRVGLMKYDGTAQPFQLEVASIRFD